MGILRKLFGGQPRYRDALASAEPSSLRILRCDEIPGGWQLAVYDMGVDEPSGARGVIWILAERGMEILRLIGGAHSDWLLAFPDETMDIMATDIALDRNLGRYHPIWKGGEATRRRFYTQQETFLEGAMQRYPTKKARRPDDADAPDAAERKNMIIASLGDKMAYAQPNGRPLNELPVLGQSEMTEGLPMKVMLTFHDLGVNENDGTQRDLLAVLRSDSGEWLRTFLLWPASDTVIPPVRILNFMEEIVRPSGALLHFWERQRDVGVDLLADPTFREALEEAAGSEFAKAERLPLFGPRG